MNITLDDVFTNIVANIIAALILMLVGFISGHLFLIVEKNFSYKSRQEKKTTRIAFGILLTILATLSPSQLDDARLTRLFTPVPVVATASATVRRKSRYTHPNQSQKTIENSIRLSDESIGKVPSYRSHHSQAPSSVRQETITKPYISPLYPSRRKYREGRALKHTSPKVTLLYRKRRRRPKRSTET